MQNRTETLNKLLNKPCYIIDYLPETVPESRVKAFLEIEYYLLNSKKHSAIKDKFVSVILKMMGYYSVSVLWNGWTDEPKPELIENAVSTIMENHSGTLNCMFPDINMLLVFDWDCLNLSIYNPPAETCPLLAQIALSEGLFWRPGI